MTTPNFANLKTADIDPRMQREYTFYEIEGEPSLLVRVCGEKNRPLFRRIQKRAAATNRVKLNSEQIQKKARKNARELFPGADGCIDAWPTSPVDFNGARVEFTVENCTAFLTALPDHLIDGLVGFVTDSSNFVADGSVSEESAEDLAEN